MARLQKRDDRYKWAIRDAIMAVLFTRMQELHDKDVRDLASKNCIKMGYSHLSFLYNGIFYNAEFTPGPPVRQRLHPEFVPEAKKLQDEFGYTLTTEKVKVSGYLSSVLAQSLYPGDYLLLLPPALHGTVKGAIQCSDWSTTLSPEKIAAFKAKYHAGYELVRQRMALNLIL